MTHASHRLLFTLRKLRISEQSNLNEKWLSTMRRMSMARRRNQWQLAVSKVDQYGDGWMLTALADHQVWIIVSNYLLPSGRIQMWKRRSDLTLLALRETRKIKYLCFKKFESRYQTGWSSEFRRERYSRSRVRSQAAVGAKYAEFTSREKSHGFSPEKRWSKFYNVNHGEGFSFLTNPY